MSNQKSSHLRPSKKQQKRNRVKPRGGAVESPLLLYFSTSDKEYYVNFESSHKKKRASRTPSLRSCGLADFSRLPLTNRFFVTQFDAAVLVDIEYLHQDVVAFL